MLFDSAIIILGFIGLIWGADKFVFGASGLARNLGVSPLMIGLTIVAFGTSAPEIFSSAVSAWDGKPELAIGNALGSNLFNVGVAIGIAAIISPLKPPESLADKELPALLLVTFVSGALLVDLYLGFIDAIVLVAITGFFSYTMFRNRISASTVVETSEKDIAKISNLQAVAYLSLGLALLVFSAEALVHAASSIAESLGISTSIIGLTIIALGTSLPELATSVTSVLKNQDDIAIGNIVGSNIMNLLIVLPFPGLLSAGPIEAELFYRDYTGVLIITLILAWFCYRGIRKDRQIGRVSGIIFLSIYCGWFAFMFFQVYEPAIL
ncbi:MAG: calcium/sodium antiporter [Gammaproteobacteria bacterium]|nr:calcium/sodium antiporter [Gammaproteobacteria bacterium]MCY4357274.1 calcium/sodium antiporter [Gammaproteobacteria bacterium]